MQRAAVLEQVGASGRNTLVITEGLLVYLSNEQVADLAAALRAQASFRWWLSDIASPRLLKMLEKSWGKELRSGGTPFRFAPAEGTAFFEPFGWYEHEYRSTGEEARRLNRLPLGIRFFGLLGRFSSKQKQEEMRRMAGIVMLRSGRHSS